MPFAKDGASLQTEVVRERILHRALGMAAEPPVSLLLIERAVQPNLELSLTRGTTRLTTSDLSWETSGEQIESGCDKNCAALPF